MLIYFALSGLDVIHYLLPCSRYFDGAQQKDKAIRFRLFGTILTGANLTRVVAKHL